MSVIAPEWRLVSFDQPERLGPNAAWLTPGMPVWCARIDPAFTAGRSWFVLSRGGDHEFTLRLPSSFLADASMELLDESTPRDSVLSSLSHLYTKSCERVYDHLLAKYGTES